MKGSLVSAGAASLLVAIASPAAAQGFGVFEHGTCAMARAGAVVARGCGDGSGIFYNPSSLLGHQGLTVSGGVTMIAAKGSFTDDATATTTDLANSAIPVPHVYAQYGINDKLAVGAGLFVPYGLGTKWPETFEGRFNGYDNKLQTIYVQPTIAYAFDLSQPGDHRLQIGAGLDVAIGSVKLSQYVDLSESPVPGEPITFAALGIPFHTPVATAVLNASGATGIGGNVGVTVKLTDAVTFGARYLSRVKLNYSGTATFTQVATGLTLPPGNALGAPGGTPLDAVVASAFAAGGPLVNQTVTTSITMPDQAVGGLAFQVSPSLLVEGDFQWVHWGLFSELPVSFEVAPSRIVIENYQNSYGGRFGAEWTASDNLKLRGGYTHHTAAAPDQTVTPLLPEGARNEFVGGLGWSLSDKLEVNVAYQFIRQDKRRGRVREAAGATAPTTALNSGLYDFYAHLAAATFTIHF